VGAFRTNIMKQFLGESVFISFIALIIAVLLIQLFLPVFNNLSGKQLSLNDLGGLSMILGLLGVTLLTGIISGIYPAVLLSSFKTVRIFKGAMIKGKGGALFRRVLVVVQFSLSILLIIGAGIAHKQLHYIKKKNLGFQKEQVLYVPLVDQKGPQDFYSLKNKLKQNANILGVTASDRVLTYVGSKTSRNDWEGKDPNKEISIYRFIVDYDFVETLGMKLIEGRSFSSKYQTDEMRAFVVNQEVKKALASEAQIIILGAGSSAGSKDYTRHVMEKMGEILVHGIAAMPGKPTLIGKSGEKIMIGAPGYPVSSIICYEEIIHPLLNWLNHRPSPKRQRVPVTLTRKLPSKLGQEEFLRLSIGQVGPNRVATPLPRGAGIITSVTKAQGIARIPSNSEGKMPGEELEAELLVPESELDQVLVCIGSHDNTLDLLANELMGLDNPINFASTHVGSLGGLNALKNGSAHLAGSHLFDPESQDYNFPFFAKYLENELILVVNLAIRHQGLMVAKGNPKNIQGIKDLSREDVRFINRQRGAGTRILLDEHLKQAGISVDQVKGYSQEEYTHMAIAVNVLSGAADCGMGIYAACKALDLDFVPLARERYDLIIPEVHQEDPKIQTLLQLIRSGDFQAKVRDLGGYETYLTGQIMEPGQGLSKK